MLILLTTCTCCLVFLLWRRASRLRAVVGHQLKSWTNGTQGSNGRIRLSLDEGPPSTEFLDPPNEDDDEDAVELEEDEFDLDDEPLTRISQVRSKGGVREGVLFDVEDGGDGNGERSLPSPPPPPPPKDLVL